MYFSSPLTTMIDSGMKISPKTGYVRLNYENHLKTIKKIHALSCKDAEETA